MRRSTAKKRRFSGNKAVVPKPLRSHSFTRRQIHIRPNRINVATRTRATLMRRLLHCLWSTRARKAAPSAATAALASAFNVWLASPARSPAVRKNNGLELKLKASLLPHRASPARL